MDTADRSAPVPAENPEAGDRDTAPAVQETPAYTIEFAGSVAMLDLGEYGTIRAVFIHGRHVAVSTSENSWDRARVRYYGRLYDVHFFLWKSLDWHEDPAKDHMPMPFTVNEQVRPRKISPAGRRILYRACREAVVAFVAEHPDVLGVAEAHWAEQHGGDQRHRR